MTLGVKIKKIRIFRGMTQKELGVAIGLAEKGADNRIAQYETDYRTPKKDALARIAVVLRVNPSNFYSDTPCGIENLIQSLFWLNEDQPGTVTLYAHGTPSAPVGLYLESPLMSEWLQHMQDVSSGLITDDEYFEWMLNP